MEKTLALFSRVHELFWRIVPGVQYADSLKMVIRPRASRRPDFPVHLSLSREITKRDTVLEVIPLQDPNLYMTWMGVCGYSNR